MPDIVAEAVTFFNEVRDEHMLDLASVLTWGYVLGPLDESQADAVIEALSQQGFGRAEAVCREEDPSLREVRFLEATVHTPDSFAQRIQGLAEFARQHGCEVLDWTIEAGPEGEPDDESEDQPEPEAAAGVAAGDRIVDVYTTANAVEAYALRTVLEDAGIQAKVVGDFLGNAAGGLPLGVAIGPRIWVHGNDARQAREIIAHATTWHPSEAVEWPEEGELPEGEESAEAEEEAPPPDGRLAFLSGGFFVAAIAIALFGAVEAWRNWGTLRTRSAAGAYFVGASRTLRYVPPPDDPNNPLLGFFPRSSHFRTVYVAHYVYLVDGKKYRIAIESYDQPPLCIPIYYDPHYPADHVVGPLMPPWLILVFAACAGAFLCFVGRQFR